MRLSMPSSSIDFFKYYTALPYIKALQSRNPLIHCITNTVVQNFTANILLAVGASPAMIAAEEEVTNFVPSTNGLLINIGTVTASSAKSMLLAATTASNNKTPWVFDPVAVGPNLAYRTNLAMQLLALRPTLVRCNASEILVLDQKPSKSRGVDSNDDMSEAILSADALAANLNTIIVLTGETDYITDGNTRLYVTGGHYALTRITGTGCGLSALIAAFIASHSNHLIAAASACALMARSAEKANLNKGLGSFGVNLLDNLSQPLALFQNQEQSYE